MLTAEIKRKISTHLHFFHQDVSLNNAVLTSYGFSFYRRRVALATINILKTSMLGSNRFCVIYKSFLTIKNTYFFFFLPSKHFHEQLSFLSVKLKQNRSKIFLKCVRNENITFSKLPCTKEMVRNGPRAYSVRYSRNFWRKNWDNSEK